MHPEQLNATTEINLPTANLNTRTSQKKGRGCHPSNPQFRGGSSNHRSRGRGNSIPYSSGPSNARPCCQIRLKPGHTTTKCWYHFDQDFQTTTAPQAYNITTQSSSYQA